MSKSKIIFAALCSLGGGFLWAAAPALSRREIDAKFPADVGPDTIDVSGYPAHHQDSYEFFRHACSVCHSPARALHSSLRTYDQWNRYVRRMHVRAQEQLLTPEDSRRLVDFLVYDSRQRKIKNKKAFDVLQGQIHKRFEEVQMEKARLRKKTKQAAQEPAPYTGAR
ncbi:MAG: hypothetical protein A2992_07785 [Elusimicrobia bacterium RIFCSPLOWO2_01_FULL_59_12]|nr:MAG: hypothetical protein A2992_07785 [Elusimicrobia bacterium RIFCSPLOWO2_01_FULL_59_12]